MELARHYPQHITDHRFAEPGAIVDFDAIQINGVGALQLRPPVELAGLVGKVVCFTQRQRLQPWQQSQCCRFTAPNGLRHQFEVADPDAIDGRGKQNVLLRHQGKLALGAGASQIIGKLADHGQGAVQLLAGQHGIADIHRDNDVGPQFPGHIHRHVIDHAAIGQQITVYFDRLQDAGHRHRGLHRRRQVPFFQYHRGDGFHVGRHRTKRYRQVVEAVQARQIERALSQQRAHRLALKKAVGQAQLPVFVDADIGTQQKLVVLALAPERQLVPPHLVLIALIPVEFQQLLLQLGGIKPQRIHTGHIGAHAGAGNNIDRNTVLFQHLDNADMGRPFGAAATEHQGDFRPLSLSRLLSMGCNCAQQ